MGLRTRLVDTTFLVDPARGGPAGGRAVDRVRTVGEPLAVPTPCVAESFRGMHRTSAARRARAQEPIEPFEAFPLDAPAAWRAGVLSAEVPRRGGEVAMVDCVIAGLVVEPDGTLLSRDLDLARIPGRTIETYGALGSWARRSRGGRPDSTGPRVPEDRVRLRDLRGGFVGRIGPRSPEA